MTLLGADSSVVRDALDGGDALPGTSGFAGEIDGHLVRDVLGRYPLYYERDDPATWQFRPTGLAEPVSLPGGAVHDTVEVHRAWKLPDPTPALSDGRAVGRLKHALQTTIDDVDTQNLAVAFSGGLDSALLAATVDVPLYTIGFPESHDLEAARTGATLLDRTVRVIELDHALLKTAVPRVARTIGRTNAMDVQIAVPLFLLAERVAEDGYDHLLLGQGADELFGGYAKIARAPEDHRVAAETVRGAQREVIQTLPSQLARDWLAITEAGVDPSFPYLQDRVVRLALGLCDDQLVRDGIRKWTLRQAGTTWLPTELALREKKALQYGSLVARELDRLARQAGFKRRMDDHISRYVAHRCEAENY